MPIRTARNALESMWPLLFESQSRLLNEVERAELLRLCNELKTGLKGQLEYNRTVDQLCGTLHSSGIFEGKKLKQPQAILAAFDSLREMLDRLDVNGGQAAAGQEVTGTE